MSEFLIFRRLESKQEAAAIQKILTRKNIPNVFAEERPLLDTNIIGQRFEPPFYVKVPEEHFPAAEEALIQAIDISDIEVEEDYYLLSFSIAELKEVIEKKDEWGNYDYALALQLLEKRGHKLSKEDIRHLQSKRVATLAVPEVGADTLIIAGYFSVIMGGALGVLTGYFLMTQKKILPDGSKVYSYDSRSRQHGRYIMITGVISCTLWNIFYIFFDGSVQQIIEMYTNFNA